MGLENEQLNPSDQLASEVLFKFDSDYARNVWKKALDRRATDPSGAITAARTTLESVCKRILDKKGITYSDNLNLPDLFNKALSAMKLSPEQQTDRLLRDAMGGCRTIVHSLSQMRNELSDAHGKGTVGVEPKKREVELALNLAAAISVFLIEVCLAEQQP